MICRCVCAESGMKPEAVKTPRPDAFQPSCHEKKAARLKRTAPDLPVNHDCQRISVILRIME